MSGHSKWSTIKHKKAKVDAQKGVAFAKFSKEITVAAKIGGVDPASNFRLRTAIDKAKESGLPNDNIKRAVEKAQGSGASDNIEEISYEGYGPGGVAVFIEAMTDNRNRTVGDIRSYFRKFSGNLGESGCVGWMFKPQGEISLSKDYDFDKLFEDALNAGAEDIQDDEEEYKIITSTDTLQAVCEALEKAGYKYHRADFTRVPENTIEITDSSTAQTLLRLMDAIENHDDVQNVYANFDMSDELINQLNQ